MGRIAKQDAHSIVPYPLSISSGPEFVTAVTSEMNPSTLVGFRWNENNAFRRPFFQLLPSGARDVLDISTHRTEDTVWIVVATAQHPGILLFQWEDGLDFPEPTAVQPAPIPGSPRSVPRTILPYDITQGSKRWLIRADPSNDVWLLSLDTLGNASWTRTLDMPVAGLSISAKGEIFAWVIRDGKTQMERWLLSGTQL